MVLIHKVDTLNKSKKQQEIRQFWKKIAQVSDRNVVEHFGTSIWDETLYFAWSKILRLLIPNVAKLNSLLSFIARHVRSDEIILIEKFTYLIIGSYFEDGGNESNTKKRFEQFSTFLKKFKISCTQAYCTSIQFLEFKNRNFHLLLKEFTPSTYLVIISYGKRLNSALIKANIESLHEYLQKNKKQFDYISLL